MLRSVKRERQIHNGTFGYIGPVDETRCFGWLHSATKKMHNGITAQRSAPIRKDSVWSKYFSQSSKRNNLDRSAEKLEGKRTRKTFDSQLDF